MAATETGSVLMYKERTYDLVGARAGRRILDVGCGSGEDAMAMARLVAPGGQVVGVDLNAAELVEARTRSQAFALPVVFEAADATVLPYAGGSFDGCRADLLFRELADPEKALEELVRVARPGARVVVADVDFGSAVIDVSDRQLGRKVQTFLIEQMPNPWSGRRLPGMFKRAGLTDVQCTVTFWPVSFEELRDQLHLPEALGLMRARGLATAQETENLTAELESKAAAGDFFCGISLFVVVGAKPQ
ncbi:MAG TPA: methyltransferase domain-containing protein [Symbiobacteriaceae bacterium]|nr:methyltransferase domain-containing protein [Symbiobacteriaceae bacterium]